MIDQAHTALLCDDSHHLNPFYRREIYSALGSPMDITGWRCRVRLEIITVCHLFPIWEQHWPDYPIVEQLLSAAESVLDGTLDHKAAGILAEDTQNDWEEGQVPEPILLRLYSSDPIQVVLNQIGLAAIRTLFTASGVNPFANLVLDERRSDDDAMDWDAHDAASWIASAYSNLNSDPTTLANKRLEFWEWWLDVAIPTAWEATQ